MFESLILRTFLFLSCSFIIYTYGRLPFAEIDSVPLSTGIIFIIYALKEALIFRLITLVISDIIGTKFNQYTVVNAVSLITAVSMAALFQIAIGHIGTQVVIIMSFNLLCKAVTRKLAEPKALISSGTHLAVYLIILSLASHILAFGLSRAR